MGGFQNYRNAIINISQNIWAGGPGGAYTGASITSSHSLTAFSGSFFGSTLNGVSEILSFGQNFNGAGLTNFVVSGALGWDVGQDANWIATSKFFGIGSRPAQKSTFTNVDSVYPIGDQPMDTITLKDSAQIYAFGTGLRNATVTNSAGIYAIGGSSGNTGPGTGISGAYTNVVLVGDNEKIGATGKDRVILGPNMTLEAPGGVGSAAVSTITTSATGATNTLSVNVVLYVTAATGASLTDNAATTEFSGVTIAAFTPIRLQP